ncbi:unnamed protein product [Prunus armeniaca]
MSSIDVFLFSSAPSGPQKTLILGFGSDFFHILPLHSQSSHRQNSVLFFRCFWDFQFGYVRKMSDSKLFVFGSLSEDKTMSLLQKQSPGKAEKHVEKNGLSKVQPLSSLNKQNEVEAVKVASDSLPASLTTPTEKATTDNIDVASLPLSNNKGGLSNQFPSLELHNREQNGRVDDLLASKGICAFSMQHYGLFYPVGYPTLGAFAEFVSEFDMPSGSSSKNKDASVLETGRPFSPTMFEGILKIFTLDVPTSISGRPRFVFDLGQ